MTNTRAETTRANICCCKGIFTSGELKDQAKVETKVDTKVDTKVEAKVEVKVELNLLLLNLNLIYS
jgi:hypothetical protein